MNKSVVIGCTLFTSGVGLFGYIGNLGLDQFKQRIGPMVGKILNPDFSECSLSVISNCWDYMGLYLAVALVVCAILFLLHGYFTRSRLSIKFLGCKIFPYNEHAEHDPFFLNTAKEPNNVLFGLKMEVTNESDSAISAKDWKFYCEPDAFIKTPLSCKVFGGGPLFGFPITRQNFIGEVTAIPIGPRETSIGTVGLEIPENVRQTGLSDQIQKPNRTYKLVVECRQNGKQTVRKKLKFSSRVKDEKA